MRSDCFAKKANFCLMSLIVSYFFSLNLAAFQANSPSLLQPKVINYCIDPDWMPYEALSNGEHIGISSDYLVEIEDSLGIQFNLIKTSTWSESIKLLQAGKCNMTTMVNQSPNRNQYLDFSDVYFSAPNVLVSLKDQPFLQGFANVGSRSLAVTRHYRILEYIETYFPNIKTINVDNEQQGLNYVAEGKSDLFVGSMLSVNNYIQQRELYDLKITGWAGPEDKLRVAVTKPYNYLLPAINKAIGNLSEQRRIDIFNKWIKVIPSILWYFVTTAFNFY